MHRKLPALLFVFISAVAVALAQPGSLEERLQRLESEVGSLRKENQQLRSELGLEGRAGQTIVKPAGREPTLSIGGLVQAQADFGDKGDDHRKLCSMYLGIMDRMGVKLDRFGDADNRLAGF